MTKPKKPRGDINVTAFQTLQAVTGAQTGPRVEPPADKPKNAAAVSLGRLGGLKGGKARAESLSNKQRSEIAKKAAQARWSK